MKIEKNLQNSGHPISLNQISFAYIYIYIYIYIYVYVRFGLKKTYLPGLIYHKTQLNKIICLWQPYFCLYLFIF